MKFYQLTYILYIVTIIHIGANIKFIKVISKFNIINKYNFTEFLKNDNYYEDNYFPLIFKAIEYSNHSFLKEENVYNLK